MRLTATLGNLLPDADLQRWVQIILPTSVAYAVILSNGPWLQTSIAPTFSKQAPSLYAAVYGEALAGSPSLLEWFKLAVDPYTAIPAVLSTLYAFGSKTRRGFAVRGAISATVLLTLSDIIGTMLGYNQAPFSTSFLFNLLSLPINWLIFTLFMVAYSRLSVPEITDKSNHWPYYIVVLSMGIISSIFVFSVYTIFYAPSDVKFDVRVLAPAEGAFSPDRSQLKVQDGNPMTFLPEDAYAKSLTIMSPRGEISAEWKKIDPNSIFTANMTFYLDCAYTTKISDLPPGKPSLSINPKSLSTQFGKGYAQLDIDQNEARRFSLRAASPTYYWMESKSGSELTGIAVMVDEKDSVSVNPDRYIKYLMTAPLISVEDKFVRVAERRLTIRADQSDYVVIAGGGKVNPQDKPKCRSIYLRDIKSASEQRPARGSSATFLSVLVELSSVPIPVDKLVLEQSRLDLEKANGWVTISDLDLKQSPETSLGNGSTFSAVRNVDRLIIDGGSVQTNPSDNIQFYGNFSADLRPRGVDLSGMANGIWLNGRRLNPTMWERFSPVWQIPLITAFVGLIGFLGRRFGLSIWKFARLNEKLILK